MIGTGLWIVVPVSLPSVIVASLSHFHARPAFTYRQWLYPVPSLLAPAGWCYVYASSGHTPIVLSLVVLATGPVAFLAWAKAERGWPFRPEHIHAEFRVPA